MACPGSPGPVVAGRQVEVGDDRVASVPRVEFAEGTAGDPLVGPGGAEGLPLVGEGLLLVDDNPRYPRLDGGGAQAEHGPGGEASRGGCRPAP